jgi:hypothetical protein
MSWIIGALVRKTNGLPGPPTPSEMYVDPEAPLRRLNIYPDIVHGAKATPQEADGYQSNLQLGRVLGQVTSSIWHVFWNQRTTLEIPDALLTTLQYVSPLAFGVDQGDGTVGTDLSAFGNPAWHMPGTFGCGTKLSVSWDPTRGEGAEAIRCEAIELSPPGYDSFTVDPTSPLWPVAKHWHAQNTVNMAIWGDHIYLHRSVVPVCYALRTLGPDHVLRRLLSAHCVDTLAFHDENDINGAENVGNPLIPHAMTTVGRFESSLPANPAIGFTTPAIAPMHPTLSLFRTAIVVQYMQPYRVFISQFVDTYIDVLQTDAESLAFVAAWFAAARPTQAEPNLVLSRDEWVELLSDTVKHTCIYHSVAHAVATAALTANAFNFGFRTRVPPPSSAGSSTRLGNMSWFTDKVSSHAFLNNEFVVGEASDKFYSDISYGFSEKPALDEANRDLVAAVRALDAKHVQVYPRWHMMASVRN